MIINGVLLLKFHTDSPFLWKINMHIAKFIATAVTDLA